MADLSDFKRGQFFDARMAGASVTKTAESSSLAKSTVPKVMTAFEKEGKTSSLQQKSGRKWKLSDRDRRTLTWIVRKDYKNTAPKITAELNGHLKNQVSSKTVRRELHKAGFHGRTAIRKPYQNKFVWNFHVFPLFCPNRLSLSLSLSLYIYIYIYTYILLA